MKETERWREKRVFDAKKILNITMAFIYFMVGLILAFAPLRLAISEPVKWLVAILLVLYSVFRFYRAFK